MIKRLMRMKHLFITSNPKGQFVGGIGVWTRRLIEYMNSNEIDYFIINNSSDNSSSITGTNSSFLEKIMRARRILVDVDKTLENYKPSIVHLNSNCSKLGLIRDYLIAKKIKKHHLPLVVHFHCNIQDQIQNSKIGKKYFGLLIKLADEVFVLNQKSLSYVEFIGHKKIIILPNPIEESYIVNNKVINNQIRQICFVGHILPSKGISLMLRTAEKFPNINFIFVGQMTHFYEKDFKNAKNSNVFCTGSVPFADVKNFLDESDVFFFPSHTEGFSYSLLEGMSRGMPIIATDVGANKDMIENNGGIIISVDNLEEAVDAINRINSQELRKNMSKWNIDKVRNVYLDKRVFEIQFAEYEKLYQKYNPF